MTPAVLETPPLKHQDIETTLAIGQLAAVGVLNHQASEVVSLETVITGTPKELAVINFLSFRFSQGNGKIQGGMLKIIKDDFHPDLLEPSNPQYEEVKSITEEMVINYFSKDKSHPTARPNPRAQKDSDNFDPVATNKERAKQELKELFSVTENNDQPSKDYNDNDLAWDIIDTDYKLIFRNGGRYGNDPQTGVPAAKTDRDPYASQFIEYGILGRTTHSKEYDHVFNRVASVESVRKFDSETKEYVLKLADAYIEAHPKLESSELTKLKDLQAEQIKA